MWCPTCRKEVDDRPDGPLDAADCPDCAGALLDSSPASVSSVHPNKTGEALKLLERWSDQRMFSPEGELPKLKGSAPLEQPAIDPETPRSSPPRSSRERPVAHTRLRESASPLDITTGVQQPTSPETTKPATIARAALAESIRREPEPARPTTPPVTRPLPVREAKAASPVAASVPFSNQSKTTSLRVKYPLILPSAGSHFDVQAAIREQLMTQERSWISAIGYLFSYGGIFLLTAGSGLTLWSFYDETLESIPREWLVTTVGEIFLFAGMVMLVSLVIQRVGNKLLFKISQIDDRITRIERALTTIYEAQQEPAKPDSKSLEVRKAG